MIKAVANQVGFANQNGFSVPDINIIEKHHFKDSGLSIAMVRITPKLAEHWISFLPEFQRCEKKNLLARIAQDMASGWWSHKNGETIKFDTNGNLIDGQHRVKAVFRSGTTIDSLVVWGCDPKEIETIDAGQSRSMSDTFKIAGIENYTHVAAMVSSILVTQRHGYITAAVPSKKEALAYATKHNDRLQYSHKISRKASAWLPITMAGYLHYLYSMVSKEIADQMLQEFAKPAGDRGNAIQVLKDMMSKINGSGMAKRSYNNRFWKNAVAIKAFNAYFMCQDVSILRYSRNEKYPRIVDTFL